MKDFDDIGDSVEYWRDVLGLSHYKVFVRPEPADSPDALLTVSTVPGRKIANINVGVDFFKEDEDEQEHAVVHELLHILTETSYTRMLDIARPILSSDAISAIKSACMREMEYTTDHIADVVYELGKKGRKKGVKKNG